MKRILTKETILIVLFLMVASLIMLGVFYYNMSVELSTNKKQNIDKIRNEYKIAILKYESIAKFVYSNIDNNEDLKELLLRSRKEKNLIKKHLLRKELIDILTPYYNELKRHEFSNIQLHFVDGVNFIRMKQKTKFGDKVSPERRTIIESNRNKKYSSGLEKGRFASAYRYVFPIFFNDEHIGSIEFSVSLQTLTNSLVNLFGSNYQIILKRSSKEIENFNTDEKQWCRSVDLYTIGYSNYDIEKIIEKSNKKEIIFQKISGSESFNNDLISDGIEYLVGFLSIANSIGDKVGYLVEVKESNEMSKVYKTFVLNSAINILISIMLIIFILSYNNVQGRIKEIKMFDAMVVTANHEIKQPLSIISAYIEILLNDENIDKKVKIKLRKIWANADKINSILEKLRGIEDPSYIDYANFTKMIDIKDKNKSSVES
ncbi:MAG: hypothetical protein KAS62_10150 [Candidatus Delongbacteria bacterium]|nr:hypothetical protein [Candidatus Delongbacteria bacterium]